MSGTRFRSRPALPDLPKGAERAIIEQFRAVEAALDEVQGIERSSRPVIQAPSYQARAGELVLIEGRTGGTLVTIPAGSSANVEQKIRVALVGGVLSPGVTIAIVGRIGTINGVATLTMTARGIVELTSVGERGWVAIFTSSGAGATPTWAAVLLAGNASGGTAVNLTGGSPLQIAGNAGLLGNVLTSQGAGVSPIWAAPAAASVAMTDATITLPYAGRQADSVTVVDAAIGAASKIGIFWGTVLASDANSPELDDITFTATPAAGSMSVLVSAADPQDVVGGPYKIRYLIAT